MFIIDSACATMSGIDTCVSVVGVEDKFHNVYAAVVRETHSVAMAYDGMVKTWVTITARFFRIVEWRLVDAETIRTLISVDKNLGREAH